ncbi:cytochrome o ubiquinol oxidase [Salmonella enterica subsp. enterica serovar Choleraesuis]|nr:cytochrome o ubiquinol oxidase [Salmonella enterica subsp. enterica serovar Choleraesuis]
MPLQDILNTLIDLINAHPHLALALVFALSFGESLAFISLLLPATLILLGLGAVLAQTGLGFPLLWAAATLGAFCGDWLSWWIGFHYRRRVRHWWPFTRSPRLLVRGHAFFIRYGTAGVFLGRFFGPLRAVVPLVAGICTMQLWRFQLANLASAAIWAFAMLAPGLLGLPWLSQWFS